MTPGAAMPDPAGQGLQPERRTPGEEPWFDAAARAFAGGISRRAALKRVAAGLATTAVPSLLRGERASASSSLLARPAVGPPGHCGIPTPKCPHTLFPYTRECRQKHQVKDSAKNGCGAEKGFWTSVGIPPDRPLGLANFNGPCNIHDCCYGTCGADKRKCDQNFREGMRDACNDAKPGVFLIDDALFAICAGVADIYHSVVSGEKGQEAYDTAQKDYCKCCGCDDDSQCKQTNDKLTCCDRDCVDLQTDVKHCGSCGHACPSGGECRGGRCYVEPVCPSTQYLNGSALEPNCSMQAPAGCTAACDVHICPSTSDHNCFGCCRPEDTCCSGGPPYRCCPPGSVCTSDGCVAQ